MLPASSTLKTDAAQSSETLASTHHTIQHYPEKCELYLTDILHVSHTAETMGLQWDST